MKATILLTSVLLLFVPSLSAQNCTVDWFAQIGGSGNDKVSSFTTDTLGNVYTTGTFDASMDLDPGPTTLTLTPAGAEDIYICKFDPSGQPLWAKRIGGAGSDYSYKIVLDQYDCIYVSGEFSGTVDFDPGPTLLNFNAGAVSDGFILKLNSSGDLIWAKQLSGTGRASIIDMEFKANHLYMAGGFEATVDFDPSSGNTFNLTAIEYSDNFIMKLDTAGALTWAKQIGGYGYDGMQAMTVDNSGNVYTTGTFQSLVDFNPGAGTFNLAYFGMNDIFVLKLNSSGAFLFAKQIGGTNLDTPSDICRDAAGNIYITGAFTDNADFDPSTNTHQLTTIGFSSDPFICKLSSAGSFGWVRSFTAEDISSMLIDQSGSIYISGSVGFGADLDPGTGVHGVNCEGLIDAYISKLNNSGDLVWVEHIGSSGAFAWFENITLDQSGDLLASVRYDYKDSLDIQPGPDSALVIRSGANDGVIVKYSLSSPIALSDHKKENNSKLYPNPCSDEVTIIIKERTEQQVEILNALGQNIYSEKILGERLINTSKFEPGIYFLKVNGLYVSRLLKF